MRIYIAAAVAALLFSLTAAAEPYVFAGGSANDKLGGLAAGAGVRSSNVGLEAAYEVQRVNAETLISSGNAISHTDSTRQWRGASIAVVGFAPIATLPATGVPLELVGRAARSRMRAGDDEAWRTTIGAGLQYGQRGGWALRTLVERADDQTVFSLSLIKAF
jgi:hypothetical protein